MDLKAQIVRHSKKHQSRCSNPTFVQRGIAAIQAYRLASRSSGPSLSPISGDTEEEDVDSFTKSTEALACVDAELVRAPADFVCRPIPTMETHSCLSFKESFQKYLIDGYPLLAASLVVARAAYQTITPPTDSLTLPNIMLFLHLGKLVFSIGQLQQWNLHKVLAILYPYANTVEQNKWSPIPCNPRGFRSAYVNVSNSNSLASILPIPIPSPLDDGHGYTSFRSILAHALMMKTFDPKETKDQKWVSLVSCEKFQSFLQKIPLTAAGIRKIAVGIILWTDGWDPSTSTKSNRTPMHTGTITLVFVDVETGIVVGVATFPNMGGPGKINHEPAFQLFKDDLIEFESEGSDRVFPSRHFSGDVEIFTSMLFVIQDQQERRPASGLLGGGSTLHIVFGISCDFKRLDRPFNACKQCSQRLRQYLAAADWTDPPNNERCSDCISWSLENLTKATYQGEPYPEDYIPSMLDPDAPGHHLFLRPGRLPSILLKMGWDYCLDMFVHHNEWVESEVKCYLKQLCINDATVDYFIQQSRRFAMLEDVQENPGDYELYEIEATLADAEASPELYFLPLPPAMWSLGDTDDKVEGIMHLSMGVQKAVFKFIIRWASRSKNGAALQRRLETLLSSVQKLKLSYAPCRPYKDDKFGGFTAEVYRAMCMMSVWLYSCLEEDDLQPSEQHEPDMNVSQKKWKKKDNLAYMELHGVEFHSKIPAKEASLMVKRLMATNNGLGPPIVYDPNVRVASSEIRDLVWRTFNMFRALFCTDIAGTKAKNRSTASVMHFLSLIEDLDVRMHPKRTKPIWIAKFNFLSLLRACESFERFNHLRNLYEGGDLGEGVVKDLRPLTAKGVGAQWATNLLLAYYRRSTLGMLIGAIKDTNAGPEKIDLFYHIREYLEESKIKRYSTMADARHILDSGQPLPLVIYGIDNKWKAGVVVVYQNHWFFCEIVFEEGTASRDVYGLSYHRIHMSDDEHCLAGDVLDLSTSVGMNDFPFWTYGIMFPDFIRGNSAGAYRYALVRSSWQFLDSQYSWNEFSL
jgi:hypothetical protein